MDLIEVIARFDKNGRATPLSFNWQGGNYVVDSTGRRWEDEAGEHILVMVPGDRVFELVFLPGISRWYLKKPGLTRTHA